MSQQDLTPGAGSPDLPDERPAEPAAARQHALDARVLAQLRQLDADGANRLIPRLMETFVASQRKLLAQIAGAQSTADRAALGLAVHTLKSASASVGAMTLSGFCAAAEDALRAGQFDQLSGRLANLSAEAARVETAVLQLLSDS